MAILIGALIGALIGVAAFRWWLRTARGMEDLNLPPMSDTGWSLLGGVAGAIVGAVVGLLL